MEFKFNFGFDSNFLEMNYSIADEKVFLEKNTQINFILKVENKH
jgi:hypothetical protein